MCCRCDHKWKWSKVEDCLCVVRLPQPNHLRCSLVGISSPRIKELFTYRTELKHIKTDQFCNLDFFIFFDQVTCDWCHSNGCWRWLYTNIWTGNQLCRLNWSQTGLRFPAVHVMISPKGKQEEKSMAQLNIFFSNWHLLTN